MTEGRAYDPKTRTLDPVVVYEGLITKRNEQLVKWLTKHRDEAADKWTRAKKVENKIRLGVRAATLNQVLDYIRVHNAQAAVENVKE